MKKNILSYQISIEYVACHDWPRLSGLQSTKGLRRLFIHQAVLVYYLLEQPRCNHGVYVLARLFGQ